MASVERIPPPTISGHEIAALTARITSARTGSKAPLPASRYTTCLPIISAAKAVCTISSTASCAIGCVPDTRATALSLPPSTRIYPIGIVSIPACRTASAARTC